MIFINRIAIIIYKFSVWIFFDSFFSLNNLICKDQRSFLNKKKELSDLLLNFESSDPVMQISILIMIIQALTESKNQRILASENYSNNYHTYRSQSKISKTTSYILENSDNKLTVDQMAKYTHMVPQSFCPWFKKHSGHSFISFLNKTRVEKACQLLLTSHLQIKEIAFSCGFDSLSHFNRTFKKNKSISPRDFRLWYWK